MNTKVLIPYDLKRCLTRAQKEFESITKGTEEFYYSQLNYMETCGSRPKMAITGIINC